MDLIDREELLKDWNKKLNRLIPDEDGLHPISLETVIKALKTAPTVDAEPVRYGKWIWMKDHWECSRCRGSRFHDLALGADASFCGSCGERKE